MEEFENNCDFFLTLLTKLKCGIVQFVKENQNFNYITFGTLIQNSLTDLSKRYYIVVDTNQLSLIFQGDILIKLQIYNYNKMDTKYIRFSVNSLEGRHHYEKNHERNICISLLELNREYANILLSNKAHFLEFAIPIIGESVKRFEYSIPENNVLPSLRFSFSDKIIEIENDNLHFMHGCVFQRCAVGGPIIQLTSFKVVGFQIEELTNKQKRIGRALNIECLLNTEVSKISSQPPESQPQQNLISASTNVISDHVSVDPSDILVLIDSSSQDEVSTGVSSQFHVGSTLHSRGIRMKSPVPSTVGNLLTIPSNETLTTLGSGSLPTANPGSSGPAQPVPISTRERSSSDFHVRIPDLNRINPTLSMPSSTEKWVCPVHYTVL